MAAKRLAQSTFNWAALAERVPENQKVDYLAFKSKSDNFLRKMLANPEKPPAIDWQYYANTVPIPGLVEDFKKKYEAFQIPVPSVDAHYAKIAELEKTTEKEIADFKAESNKRIAECEEGIKKIKATIPYDKMTYEELAIYAPQYSFNTKELEPYYITEKEGDKGGH